MSINFDKLKIGCLYEISFIRFAKRVEYTYFLATRLEVLNDYQNPINFYFDDINDFKIEIDQHKSSWMNIGEGWLRVHNIRALIENAD